MDVGICKATYVPRGKGSIIICVKNFINHYKINIEADIAFVFKKSDSMKDFYSFSLVKEKEDDEDKESPKNIKEI